MRFLLAATSKFTIKRLNSHIKTAIKEEGKIFIYHKHIKKRQCKREEKQQQPHEVIILSISSSEPGWKTHKIKDTYQRSIKLDVDCYGDIQDEDVNSDIMRRLRRYDISVTTHQN